MSDQVAEMSATYLVEVARNAVPEGYKQTEVGVIPKDWMACELGQAITFQRGFDLPQRLRKAGNIPIISSSGASGFHNTAAVKAPSIVTGRYGTIGNIFYLQEDFWPLNTTLYVREFKKLLPEYALYILKTLDFASHSGKSGVPGVNRNDLHQEKIAVPPLEEQTTIANALSDVDALISELEKLIAKKQAIKTATMQQLLTGRTRLPQFSLHKDSTPKGYKQSELGEIPEDWDLQTLGGLCAYQNGKAQEKYFNPHGGYKVISIGNYSESGRYIDTGSYISKELKKEVGKFVLDRGDLAMILNDKTAVGTIIGRVILIDSDETYVMNQRTMRLAVKDGMNSRYLHLLINSESVHKRIAGMAKPGTQIYVNTDDILNFNLLLPNSEKERSSIAAILSDMDEEIQALEQRLGKTRQIKQGMMQELLTGKTRLVAPIPRKENHAS